MKALLAVAALAAVASLASPGRLGSVSAQDAPRIEVVSVGEISDIDLKKRTLQVRSQDLDTVEKRRSDRNVWRGEISIGIGGGRRPGLDRPGDRFPRGRDPFPPLPFPPDHDPLPPPHPNAGTTVTKILIDDDTVIEQDGEAIDFEALEVGDRVTVTGTPEGRDTHATRIDRRPPIPALIPS